MWWLWMTCFSFYIWSCHDEADKTWRKYCCIIQCFFPICIYDILSLVEWHADATPTRRLFTMQDITRPVHKSTHWSTITKWNGLSKTQRNRMVKVTWHIAQQQYIISQSNSFVSWSRANPSVIGALSGDSPQCKGGRTRACWGVSDATRPYSHTISSSI